jgi:hypothetical protein
MIASAARITAQANHPILSNWLKRPTSATRLEDNAPLPVLPLFFACSTPAKTDKPHRTDQRDQVHRTPRHSCTQTPVEVTGTAIPPLSYVIFCGCVEITAGGCQLVATDRYENEAQQTRGSISHWNEWGFNWLRE